MKNELTDFERMVFDTFEFKATVNGREYTSGFAVDKGIPFTLEYAFHRHSKRFFDTIMGTEEHIHCTACVHFGTKKCEKCNSNLHPRYKGEIEITDKRRER